VFLLFNHQARKGDTKLTKALARAARMNRVLRVSFVLFVFSSPYFPFLPFLPIYPRVSGADFRAFHGRAHGFCLSYPHRPECADNGRRKNELRKAMNGT
jgi:hypothetical protein